MITLTTDRLSELIGEKRQVLAQLRDVGQRQTDLINHGDTGSLLKLLAAKQQLISTLQGVERELTPFYAEDPDRRAWASPQDRAILRSRRWNATRCLKKLCTWKNMAQK